MMNPEESNSGAGEASPSSGTTFPNTDHHKTITMATIAKAAGVSQGAISSLLNDRDYGIRVSEKTRERVFKACRELRYIPNDLRAVVRMYPEMGDLCILVSNDAPNPASDPLMSRVLASAMSVVKQPAHHFTLARYDQGTDYLHNPDLLPHPVRNGTASKFICSGTPNVSLCQALIRRGYPVVYLGRDVALPGVISIMPDYAEASKLALEHLFRLGHRHIAIHAGPFGTTDTDIIELNRGLRIGFEKSDIPLEAQNIFYGELTFQNGAKVAESFLTRTPRPTALFALTDEVAAGALDRVQSRGLQIPQQFSVVGCGDHAFASLVHPTLTTIHLPAEEMGKLAVEQVEERVKHDPLTEPKRIVLPVQLVERDSASPPL
jgi:DNA-binding LacI/PurR family transcriptional regulator